MTDRRLSLSQALERSCAQEQRAILECLTTDSERPPTDTTRPSKSDVVKGDWGEWRSGISLGKHWWGILHWTINLVGVLETCEEG